MADAKFNEIDLWNSCYDPDNHCLNTTSAGSGGSDTGARYTVKDILNDVIKNNKLKITT